MTGSIITGAKQKDVRVEKETSWFSKAFYGQDTRRLQLHSDASPATLSNVDSPLVSRSTLVSTPDERPEWQVATVYRVVSSLELVLLNKTSLILNVSSSFLPAQLSGQLHPTWPRLACLRCLEIPDTFINNGDLNVCEILRGHSEMPCEDLTRVRNVTWNRRFFAATMNQKSNKNGDTDAQKLDESEDSDGHQTAKDLALDPEKMVDTPDGAAQDEKTSHTSQSQAGVSERGSSGDNDECDGDDTHPDSSKGDNGD
ncbi:hypothetical protein SAPIO_CDS3766 [Scedosporium apiospermum]|uniref:Uncharacterized protein n=1 Tax=Pseudallescheria apiosperma TaxID=563466 RepID=A0A084G9M3_PSEDA|nr:uncharacterized protein SAPIO_CDS3766 [Scedosporium apiospermum]KEZ44035.1 hypothetical protein SAPIO_CDS3766 [Scedosporium apiospermum]